MCQSSNTYPIWPLSYKLIELASYAQSFLATTLDDFANMGQDNYRPETQPSFEGIDALTTSLIQEAGIPPHDGI